MVADYDPTIGEEQEPIHLTVYLAPTQARELHTEMEAAWANYRRSSALGRNDRYRSDERHARELRLADAYCQLMAQLGCAFPDIVEINHDNERAAIAGRNLNEVKRLNA